jgi:hypothetical protein
MALKDQMAGFLGFVTGSQKEIEHKSPYIYNANASRFKVCDNTDRTKCVQFATSGVTTGTTRTVTMPDYDTTGSAGERRSVVSNASAVFATPKVLTTADSNTSQLLDVATGIDFTLPSITAANLGMFFRFYLTVEPTSNSYRWTAAAGDLLAGQVVIYDKDVTEASTEALIQINRPDGSDDLILTITGTDDTQGSLVGGWIEFEALNATKWFVRGSLIGDGALATNFS